MNNDAVRDDKGGARVDYNTAHVGPDIWLLPRGRFEPRRAISERRLHRPGFNAVSLTRAQVIMVSDTKSFGSTAVNEFRFSYLRDANNLFSPVGGLGVSLDSLGFPAGSIRTAEWARSIPLSKASRTSASTTIRSVFRLGHHAPVQQHVSVAGQLHQNNRNTQLEIRRPISLRPNQRPELLRGKRIVRIYGGETGLDFADFLIGAPDCFIQASEQILDSRTKYAGLYAQDSWRVTPNLTLNYGLRWDMIMPWYDTENKIETLIPGEQSVVFPGAPTGWVVPGDPRRAAHARPDAVSQFLSAPRHRVLAELGFRFPG